ncbi:MAG: Clp protease N-terminal domain-containing protein, partial [Myxococcota bacterium]
MRLVHYHARVQALFVLSQRLAKKHSHQAVEPLHLLAGVSESDETADVLRAVSVTRADLRREVKRELLQLPKLPRSSTYLSETFVQTARR